MGYAAVWKVLEAMIKDLRKKGANTPPEAIQDLQSAKSLLSISETERCGETLQQIDMLIQNVESYAFSEGQKLLGANYTDKWLERLGDASLKMDETQQERKFIWGLPRTRKWIRVKPSTELQIKEVELMAKETGLKCKTQKDGNLLLYGDESSVKDFVKLMTTKNKSRRNTVMSKR